MTPWYAIKNTGWPYGAANIAEAYWLGVKRGWLSGDEAVEQNMVMVPIVDLRRT